MEYYTDNHYELSPIYSASIGDLSRVVFEQDYLHHAYAPDVLAENNRTYEDRLASCKMIVSPSDTTPTIHGLLSIGKNPQAYIPGAYIQFLRIDGLQLDDPVIDEEMISGAITEMIRRIMDKIKSHNRRAVDIPPGDTHKITETYPPAAVEQIVFNAVMHRTYEHTNAPIRVYWYDNRIEIISPGGPYGNVTPENLGQPGITDYRNPNLGATMRIFGYVQSFGRGITIARNEMKRNGNPEPEFIANANIVTCILRAK